MGEEALSEEYMRTVRWMLRPGTASSHRVIGYHKGQHCQVVADELIAWTAREYNTDHLQIEMTQPTPDDPFSDYQYRCTAAVVKAWARKYGFPLDRFHIRGHEEIPPGIREGKTDPGDKWDWNRFVALL